MRPSIGHPQGIDGLVHLFMDQPRTKEIVDLIAVSGTYVMTAGEAAEAARRIQPRVAVPMHWGEHLGTRDDALAFARQAPVEVTIMEKVDG